MSAMTVLDIVVLPFLTLTTAHFALVIVSFENLIAMLKTDNCLVNKILTL